MIVAAPIEAYIDTLERPDDAVILDMEQVGREREFPIIGPVVGRTCELLARAVGAKRVFEMGSGFGYSTWWFARAVGEGGTVVHTDGSPSRSEEAKTWMSTAGLSERVDFRVGDARELLAADPGMWDVIFCDIDKEGYPEALQLARPRLRSGGLLITDNTLWGGRVTHEDPDEWTAAVRRYNEEAHGAADLLTTILPIRDGLSVSLKL